MANNLIIYYSRRGENYFGGSIRSINKGNTEYCVEYIQNAVGAVKAEADIITEGKTTWNVPARRRTRPAAASVRS